MATLQIRIKGQLGSITYRGFLTALEDWLSVLRELDAAISGQPRGSLDWVITGLSRGSLLVEVESRSALEDRNFGPQVAGAAVDGVHLVERQGISPPYLSEVGLQKVRHLVRLIGREGAEGFSVTHQDDTAELTPQASAHLDQLLRVQQRSLGSVEGRLETISLHGKPRFVVYQGLTRKAVTCNIPSDDWLKRAMEALAKRERVNVTGIVHYNAKGEPMRVDPEEIRAIGDRPQLPGTKEMSGSDPNLTGELTTVEFLRGVRGG